MAIDFKPLREYLKHGVIADYAKKNGIEYKRAKRLVSGELKNPKESDMGFIDDIIAEALKQRELIEPRNSRIKAVAA